MLTVLSMMFSYAHLYYLVVDLGLIDSGLDLVFGYIEYWQHVFSFWDLTVYSSSFTNTSKYCSSLNLTSMSGNMIMYHHFWLSSGVIQNLDNIVWRLPPQQSENIVIVVIMHKNNVIDKSEVERNLVMFATTSIPPRLGSLILY